MGKMQYAMYLRDICKKYLFAVAIVLAHCVQTYRFIHLYQGIEKESFEIHVGDYILCFFQGTMPYTMLGKDEPLNIPPYWSFYLIYFIFLFGFLYSSFTNKFEQYKIIRYTTRKRWWIEKNKGIWRNCVAYLLVSGLTFLIFGFCTGAKIRGVNAEMLSKYFGMDFQNIKGKMLPIGIAFFLTMAAIIYIQLVVSLYINSIVGILVSIAILIASVYHMHPLLIGNYLMIIRQNRMAADGMSVSTPILLCMIIILVTILAGYVRINKKDLF